jgi:L-iditol 2-dehydrogenase
MKAVVKVEAGIGKIELKDVPEPVTNPGQVKIEVKAAGICGTDLHIWHDEFPYNPPVILGHEFAGVIAEVGEGVLNFKVGDRVTCETAGIICGKCWYCRTGNYNLCFERRGLGYGIDGAFTRYCRLYFGCSL